MKVSSQQLRLPEPSPGDMFVDLEGDPFAGDLETGGGHQYLFGFVTGNGVSSLDYQKRWAFTAQEEKSAFEWLVYAIAARRQEFPGMHVFHFGVEQQSSALYPAVAWMSAFLTRKRSLVRVPSFPRTAHFVSALLDTR
jgi:hypothetical protein